MSSTYRGIFVHKLPASSPNFPIHPHMLRHSAGYKLANEGHDTRSIQQYLGH
jgi:site-specific recombinase XerD